MISARMKLHSRRNCKDLLWTACRYSLAREEIPSEKRSAFCAIVRFSASFPLTIPFFLSHDEKAIFAKQPNDPNTYVVIFVLEKSARPRRPDVGVVATWHVFIEIKFRDIRLHWKHHYLSGSYIFYRCRYYSCFYIEIYVFHMYRLLKWMRKSRGQNLYSNFVKRKLK